MGSLWAGQPPHGTLLAPRGHQDQGTGTATALSCTQLHLAELAPANPSHQKVMAVKTQSRTDTLISIPEPHAGAAPVALPYPFLLVADHLLSLPSGSLPSTWAARRAAILGQGHVPPKAAPQDCHSVHEAMLTSLPRSSSALAGERGSSTVLEIRATP